MKFCKDCKFIGDDNYENMYPECLHEKAIKIDPVSGETGRFKCSAMRIYGCADGKLFEPKINLVGVRKK